MYFSHQIGHRKPYAEYFQHIVKDLVCEPKDCVLVDDSPENVQGAQQFGMRALRFEDNPTLIAQRAELGVGRRGA